MPGDVDIRLAGSRSARGDPHDAGTRPHVQVDPQALCARVGVVAKLPGVREKVVAPGEAEQETLTIFRLVPWQRKDQPPNGEADPPERISDSDPGEPGTGSAILGPVTFVLIVGAIIYGIAQLAPDDVREKRNPGYIGNIFANDVVIAAARVVVLLRHK